LRTRVAWFVRHACDAVFPEENGVAEMIWHANLFGGKHRCGRSAKTRRVHALKRPTYKVATRRSRKRQRVETKRDEAQIRRETATFAAADSCAGA